MSGPTTSAAAAIRDRAHPLTGSVIDYGPLLDLVGDRRLVLIGEASHGTHEFYRERAVLTKRLIAEKGFTAVAVEGDWPEAERVNRFVRGRGEGSDAADALEGFRRFPAWMWRNADVLDFVGWLKAENEGRPFAERAGFYGLDLYSLHASMDAVVAYLERVDPEAARRARHRYACFDHSGRDAQAYGQAVSLGLEPSCESEAVSQLVELRRASSRLLQRDGPMAADEQFFAEQNARLVANAEAYYRAMFHAQALSWNLRDRHMAETLDALLGHLSRGGRRARLVVWAHNSHVGDARATEMGAAGEWNIGQLVRQRHGSDALLVGFTTYAGTVTAASDWHGAAERKRVRPALPGSYEALFHETGLPRFLMPLSETSLPQLREPRLERAIGVIYRPETERASHYFYASLPDQFDAVLHFDRTRAVEPLERTAEWEAGEVPETFPSGV
jgi:erythromycin esterase-like protein